MKHLYFLLMVLPLTLLVSCQQQTHLTFLETTDTHGRLANLSDESAYIAQQRALLGDNLFVFDAGDNLQGTIYTYLSNHSDDQQHIVSQIFNYMDYDVVGVGNHDIEAGKKVFDRFFSELNADVVCANVINTETGKPYFKPYVVFERDGFKIAVLGLLTPFVTTWVPERLREGLQFEKVETSALIWEKIIRENEAPDLMIAIVHSGFAPSDEQTENKVLGYENASLWVAQNSNFDIVFYGHDHCPSINSIVNNVGDSVWVVNAGSHGRNLAKVEVDLLRKKGRLTKQIVAELIPMENTGTQDDTYNQMVQNWVDYCGVIQNEKISTLAYDIESNDAVKGSNPWVDLIHQVQFDVAKKNNIETQISFAAALSADKVLHAGDLRVKDFFTLYPFENYLAVVKMTGAEVKKYLEFSYRQFFIEHGPLYNFDSADGIKYTVFLSDNKLEINILGMTNGIQFDENKIYNVAMNSYRAMGGGGHLLNGLGWSQTTISDNTIWNSDLELRNLFIEWARQFEVIEPKTNNNWSWID